MPAASGRNWTQIIVWAVVVVIVLVALAWWGGLFEGTEMAEPETPPAETTAPAPTEQAPADTGTDTGTGTDTDTGTEQPEQPSGTQQQQ